MSTRLRLVQSRTPDRPLSQRGFQPLLIRSSRGLSGYQFRPWRIWSEVYEMICLVHSMIHIGLSALLLTDVRLPPYDLAACRHPYPLYQVEGLLVFERPPLYIPPSIPFPPRDPSEDPPEIESPLSIRTPADNMSHNFARGVSSDRAALVQLEMLI
jgi:hypothetical protein